MTKIVALYFKMQLMMNSNSARKQVQIASNRKACF